MLKFLISLLSKDHPAVHYLGIAGIILLVYFLAAPHLFKLEQTVHAQGPQVVVIQPTPHPGLASVADTAADASKSTALSAALKNDAIQLSFAQSTIAHLSQQVLGLNAKFASAGVAGATAGSPKVQAIQVTSKASFSPAPVLPTDDQIVKDVKQGISESTVHVQNDVKVTWEDKPRSPIYAAYTSSGYSGAGWTIRRTPAVNLSVLGLTNGNGSTYLGVGLTHDIKNTSLTAGVAGLYDLRRHEVDPALLLGVNF